MTDQQKIDYNIFRLKTINLSTSSYALYYAIYIMAIVEQQKYYIKIIKSFISGGVAGAFNKTLIAPVERVKYLFVTSHRTFTYRSFFEDLALIVKTHGLRNLWRGNSMNIYRMFPYAAIVTVSQFSIFLFSILRADTFITKMVLFSKIQYFFFAVLQPGYVPSQQLILYSLQGFVSPWKEQFSPTRTVYMLSLMFTVGYGAAVLGVVIYQGIAFSLFTKAKEKIELINPISYKKWYVDFGLGGLSAVGQIVAYPLDILRKRMQGQTLLIEKGELLNKQNYHQLISQIYRSQSGWRGFYKGVTLNLIKAPLASASGWTIKNFLNRRFDKSYDL